MVRMKVSIHKSKSKHHCQLLTKSSALSMVYFLREGFDAVAEDAEVEEDIGNCDESLT